ncbi:MAG: acetylglutamate kinase [Sedimentisphaerales bacterium]|nr:acetylglutamate kinase [Sedimentisphaerales bacterium]
MDKATQKAKGLIEALSFIRQYKDKIVVIKLGGSLMEEDHSQRQLLNDVVFMSAVGMRPILVHGGGKSVSAAMKEAGIEPHFVQGRRYTDEKTLLIAEQVLVNEINKSIVESLNFLGAQAMGLHSLSSCVITAQKIQLDGEDGRKLDIGMVGDVTDVNADLLKVLCHAGVVPVIAPIGVNKAGAKLNINADTVAGKVAAAVGAAKLVMMSDTHGIYEKPGDEATHISKLTQSEVEEHIASGVISGGMLPKVDACLEALHSGVERAHIIDGNILHSLLLEIYTDKGIGTLITQ